MKTSCLFVYGTLRCDSPAERAAFLQANAQRVGQATYQGRLFRVDGYPGVIPSDDPQDRVRGELYRLHDPRAILTLLDRYEECGPGFPEPTEYVRQRQTVRLDQGGTCLAWIYLYNWPVDALERIPGGDFYR